MIDWHWRTPQTNSKKIHQNYECRGRRRIIIFTVIIGILLCARTCTFLDPTLAGIFCDHSSKIAHKKTLLPGSFPFMPTDVQSAHFLYKPTLVVEHKKTKITHEKKTIYFLFVSVLFRVGSFPTLTLLLMGAGHKIFSGRVKKKAPSPQRHFVGVY